MVSWDAGKAKRLGATLRALRENAGLSQEGLAFQAGITKNQLQLIEQGRGSGRRDESGPSNPRMSTLVGLTEVLGIGLTQLFRDAEL